MQYKFAMLWMILLLHKTTVLKMNLKVMLKNQVHNVYLLFSFPIVTSQTLSKILAFHLSFSVQIFSHFVVFNKTLLCGSQPMVFQNHPNVKNIIKNKFVSALFFLVTTVSIRYWLAWKYM